MLPGGKFKIHKGKDIKITQVPQNFITLNFLFSGHCKSLAPEYVKAAKTLAALDPPKYIAKVDATENKEVAERFGVKGFPTLHFFR